MPAPSDRFLSPAETAERLGVSIKALRLYESHGLVTPKRTEAQWRVYGPAEIAQLHKVIALKRLGLPLARIAELMNHPPLEGGSKSANGGEQISGRGKGLDLDSVLALQEKALVREDARLTHALELVRAARAKLASGEALSIDDLATLTTETTMSNPAKGEWKLTREEWTEIFDPLISKHFPAEKLAETTKRYFDQAKVTADWNALFDDANKVMAKGDPASPEALDIARRWRALVDLFTQGDPVLEKSAANVWADAMGHQRLADKSPVSPELFSFVGKAMAALKAKGAA